MDLSWRNPRCELQLDFMDEGGKVYPLKPVQYTIPYQIELPTPSVPNLESVVELSGAGDYLVVNGDQLRLDDASMTVECWLKPPYLKENQSLVSNLDSKAGFLLGILKGRPFLDLFLKNGEILKLIAPENRSVKLRQWQHVAGVVVDDQAFLYLDGVRVAEQTLPQGMYQGIGPRSCGGKGQHRKGETFFFFAGRMDGVRLSNVARYRAPHFTPRRRHLPDAQTQLLLNMDDIQLLWIYDESDNRAHAKVVGGTTVKADL
ncbi:LamG domain-containing protein [Verrucomicrobia bacterium]|nr:LamG domain-containing protein [Verrucomicrobiota bacterium]